jgi:phage gp16-like protein
MNATTKQSASAIRNRELAQIHIARSQLGMDDENYRNVLWTVARVKSSKDLDWSGRKRVLDHMKACGFKVRPKKLPTAHKTLALSKEDIEAKISVQLKALSENWPYAYGVGRRIFPQISRFEFLTAEQLGQVSSALERTIRFKQKKAG